MLTSHDLLDQIFSTFYFFQNCVCSPVKHIQGDSKNMSPLAFKSNNSRPMSRTSLPDTAFERTDNFLSNECIQLSVSLSNSVVTGCKPIVVRFLRVQISDGFRRTRTLCFVIPLSQHSLHLICELRTRHPRPIRASIIFSSHLGLSSKRPPRLAMHHFRRLVKACMALAFRCWEIWAQQRLRRSFRLSVPWIFTAHQPLQLSPDEEVHVMSRFFGGQASGLRYRRQTWSRYSADCCLIATQPAGTGEALADRQRYDRNLSCSAFGFFFRRKCSREQSRACKGYSLKGDKGMTNNIFSFDEI